MSPETPPRPPRRAGAWLRRLRLPLRLLLALVILFEEWGWEPLQRALATIARLPVLRQIEALIGRLPPYAALSVFLLPSLLLLPVKIGALWLMAHGQRLLGVTVIVVAKIVGTAIVARLFTLTRPALMTLPWFAALYARWTTWKDTLLTWVRDSALWRAARTWRAQLREAFQRWRTRWWRAP